MADQGEQKKDFISKNPTDYQDKDSVTHQAPSEIGKFSLDNGEFKHDESALKIFKPPADLENCDFNLLQGFDDPKPEDPPQVENDCARSTCIFDWIMGNKAKFRSEGSTKFCKLNTDFVCRRGVLTNLLYAPYQSWNEKGCAVDIIRFRGTYYIEHGALEKAELTKSTHMGLKFEQYVTSDQNLAEPDTSQPINKTRDFYSVVRTSLRKHSHDKGQSSEIEEEHSPPPPKIPRGEKEEAHFSAKRPGDEKKKGHSLVIASAVDCWDRENEHYIELKTVLKTEDSDPEREKKDANFWRYKVPKWWAQCVLHGIPTVVCGFPDDQGIVHRLERFPVKDLPERAAEGLRRMDDKAGDKAGDKASYQAGDKAGDEEGWTTVKGKVKGKGKRTKNSTAPAAIRNPWQPNVCFNFLYAFLQRVKEVITEDKCVYNLTWGPRSHMVSSEKVPGKTFLPETFVNWDAWDK